MTMADGRQDSLMSVVLEAADLLAQVQVQQEERHHQPLAVEVRQQAYNDLQACLEVLQQWQAICHDQRLANRIQALADFLAIEFDKLTDQHLLQAVESACEILRAMCAIPGHSPEAQTLAKQAIRQVMMMVKLVDQARNG